MFDESSRRTADLFLVSFLILFMELACIRWFGSMVVFLTFFTNIVLLAAFLGISVGCLAASSRRNLIDTVIPILLVGMTLACVVLYVFTRYSDVMIDVGGQGSPQQIFFGTEYRARDLSRFVVPLEAVAGVFFVLIALTFVGLGQVMGRAFTTLPNRMVAYTVNIAGSLAGIAGFALVSYERAPPSVWFAVSLGLCFYFLPGGRCCRSTRRSRCSCCWRSPPTRCPPSRRVWSPYYKISYQPALRTISTNNIGHQSMADVDQSAPAYALPHLLNRDAGGPAFDSVLIIGAGSGNDVAAALHHGAHFIDAVEIDPTINELGRRYHPNLPYADPRVTVHIDDGRSFVRQTGKKYDLVDLRAGRFAGAALGVLEHPARELPLHAGGLRGHPSRVEARWLVRGLQLLSSGLARRPAAGDDGRRLRPPTARDDDAVSAGSVAGAGARLRIHLRRRRGRGRAQALRAAVRPAAASSG